VLREPDPPPRLGEEEADGDAEQDSSFSIEEEESEVTLAAWADVLNNEFVGRTARQRPIREMEYAQTVEKVPQAEFAERDDVCPVTVGYWSRYLDGGRGLTAGYPQARMYPARFFFRRSRAGDRECLGLRQLSTGAFRTFMRDYWIRHRSDVLMWRRFVRSNTFRIPFTHRHRFSLRTPSLRLFMVRRDEAAVRQYADAAIARSGADRVCNMDEPSWRDV
jgi:hypothetical protein